MTTSDSNCLHRLFQRYSCFKDLQRTVVWLLRYIKFLRWKCNPQLLPPCAGKITVAEMVQAETAIVKAVQSQTFSEVLCLLHNHEDFHAAVNLVSEETLQKKPALKKFRSLNPYLVDGILRVGGRLQRSNLSMQEKHPVILPAQHPITALIVMMYHEREGHMGCSQVLTAIYRQYWILNGRSAVNNILKSCVKCRFWKVSPSRQQMGNLPADRVNKSNPFKAVGTDLMGPLTIRCGRNSLKRYVCIFNCLATRAVHFEIVQSLEASAFIQAFRRFCNRRNVNPTDMYSDNGGNFVAAERELKNGLKALKSKPVQEALLRENITWHF